MGKKTRSLWYVKFCTDVENCKLWEHEMVPGVQRLLDEGTIANIQSKTVLELAARYLNLGLCHPRNPSTEKQLLARLKTEKQLLAPLNDDHEIARTLVLSTAHITQNDARLCGLNIGVYPKDKYGWWVYVPVGGVLAEVCRKYELIGHSGAFIGLLELAARLNCQWLMLDRDGPVRDDLPKFDW